MLKKALIYGVVFVAGAIVERKFSILDYVPFLKDL